MFYYKFVYLYRHFFLYIVFFHSRWFVQFMLVKCHAESRKGNLCFWRNIYHSPRWHLPRCNEWLAVFKVPQQIMAVSAGSPHKDTKCQNSGKSSDLLFSLACPFCYIYCWYLVLKRHREQGHRKKKSNTIQRSDETLSLSVLVSLIFFASLYESQSQPPCVNSAGARAPADNLIESFHQN